MINLAPAQLVIGFDLYHQFYGNDGRLASFGLFSFNA